MKSSYSENDVEILLKDITGVISPLGTAEREKLIQSGVHYSEMLPLEYEPSEKYMMAYRNALANYSAATADAVAVLSEKIYRQKGNSVVIVSLARAGIPVGILIRRYLKMKYNADIKHFTISIIRGRGIDKNAMNCILERYPADSLQFVDGWIGKGAILSQLKEALNDYQGVSAEIGVLSDPAFLTDLCGTHEDILIPSSCLNATVTGLLSRTFYRSDVIGPDDFHGAAFYENLYEKDLSEQFIESIESRFRSDITADETVRNDLGCNGMETVRKIMTEYGVEDVNFVKPGIGEATRVLLRRVPWKILINRSYYGHNELEHIIRLAEEKNVSCEISKVDMGNYKVCGIIKKMADV